LAVKPPTAPRGGRIVRRLIDSGRQVRALPAPCD